MSYLYDSLIDLEAKIRADERERLANEFLERGDIGTQPGEMAVIAWLLKSEGGGGQKRRVTRDNYIELRTNGEEARTCKRTWPDYYGDVVTCGKYEDDAIHVGHTEDFRHIFVPVKRTLAEGLGPLCVRERNGTPFTCAKHSKDAIHTIPAHPNFHEFVPAYQKTLCTKTWDIGHGTRNGVDVKRIINCDEYEDHVMHDPDNDTLFAHPYQT